MDLWKTYVCSLFHSPFLFPFFFLWNNEYGFNRLVFLFISWYASLYRSRCQVQPFQAQFSICGWNAIPVRRVHTCWPNGGPLSLHRSLLISHTHTQNHILAHIHLNLNLVHQHAQTQAAHATCNLFSLNLPLFVHFALKPQGSPIPSTTKPVVLQAQATSVLFTFFLSANLSWMNVLEADENTVIH